MKAIINNRLYFIDVAKAICIILVVIGHYIPINSPQWYILLHDIIYIFHMPLFMFASGFIYIFTKKDISYQDFLIKKFKRLMMPYFVISIVIITIKLLTESYVNVENLVSLFSFLEMFWKPEAGFFLWFVWALWWIFILIPLFKTKRQRTVLFIASIILYFLQINLPDIFCLKQVKNYLIWFMLGVYCADVKPHGSFINLLAKYPIIVLLAFIFVTSIKFVSTNLIYNRIYLVFAALIGICFVLNLSQRIVKLGDIKFWVKLSGASYIIYLFHTTFMGFAKVVIDKLPLDSTLLYIFLSEAIFVILIGIVVPIVLHYYVLKRYQITKKLFDL